ncbi:MAG: response regulator [Polyangiaceae bacterium]|nr:response regulator [Polyangiaceae bacterium]
MGERAELRGEIKRAVLFIEDNTADVEYVRALLAGTAYVVTAAQTLADAEQCLREKDFNVVMLDLHLPDSAPLDAVGRVLRFVGCAPVVALTQLGDSLAYECLHAGLQDFIPKAGLTSAHLVRALDHAIVRARGAEMARRLELAERRATLGSIASYVAHEIRNQCSLLLAGSESMADSLVALRIEHSDEREGAIENAASTLEECQRTIGRIATIVEQLQVLGAAKGRDVAARADVASLVERTIATMRNRLRQSALLSLDLQPCSPAAIDEHRLAQVLVNLLRNAAEATEGDPMKQRITICLSETREHVVLEISDTGRGIAPEDQPHVFRPFFSTKTNGTGVGLAVSAEIIAAAEGDLTVASKLGVGTTFTVKLPRAAAPLRPKAPAAAPSDKGRLRILMIDDDARLLGALSLLVRGRHDVVEATSGAEALQLLSRDCRFDIILCDLMMPGMDGGAVYAAVARQYPSLAPRFALLTGGAFTTNAQAIIESGDVVVLTKPCSRSDLLATIHRLASASCSTLAAP